MTTLFDAMLALARNAGPCIEGVATSGSSTNVTDSNLSKIPEASTDGVFNQGTVFIITDAGGAGAAPEGETARVTAYVGGTGSLTLVSGDLSAAAAAGDVYGVTVVRRDLMIQAINNALRDAGRLPAENTSLTTAAATREYTIPAAAKHDLRQVWIATRKSRPYDFVEYRYWRQIRNKSTYDLEFLDQPPSGYTIRLVYGAFHSRVTADSDTIQDIIPLDWLTWRSSYHLYRWRVHQEGRDARLWTTLMNEAAEYAAQLKPTIRLPHYTTRYNMTPEPRDRSARIDTAEIPTA